MFCLKTELKKVPDKEKKPGNTTIKTHTSPEGRVDTKQRAGKYGRDNFYELKSSQKQFGLTETIGGIQVSNRDSRNLLERITRKYRGYAFYADSCAREAALSPPGLPLQALLSSPTAGT